MKPRDRVIAAIEHREPDRVPLDGWFRYETSEALKKHFGVTDAPTPTGTKSISLQRSLKRKLGIDLHYVGTNISDEFREKVDESRKKYGQGPDTQVYRGRFAEAIQLPDGTFQDEWGGKYQIGATGEYWHHVEYALQNVTSLDEFEFPDIDAPGRFDRAKEAIKEYGEEFAIIGMVGSPAGFGTGTGLRGFRTFINDLYTNLSFVNKLLDRMLDYQIEIGRRFVEMGVDIIYLDDDLGTQKTMLVNPDIWRRTFKPRMQKLIQALKKNGQIHIFHHSDGYFEPVIPDLVEIGVEILNPIQPECMDPAEIKRKYGDKLSLHGTVSVQKTLPFGTIDDVRNEVKKRMETCAPGGGFILAPAHVIGPDVSLENVRTLYEAAKKYGKYNK